MATIRMNTVYAVESRNYAPPFLYPKNREGAYKRDCDTAV
jgi:hypothetical protein